MIQIDSGSGFIETIGQIEFTASYAANPIEISNKSFDDYVTYLDEELAQRQSNLSGTLFYNSDSSYARFKEIALLGTLFKLIIVDINNQNIISEFGAIISSLSDRLNVGEAIATNVNFSGSLFDDSIARGVMTVARIDNGSGRFDIGYSASDPDFSNSRLTDNSFIEEYGVIENIFITSFGGSPLSYRVRVDVSRNFTGRLTPQSVKIKINEIECTLVTSSYFTGSPNSIIWQSDYSGATSLRFPDEDSAPATSVRDFTQETISQVFNGDQVSFSITPVKPRIPLSDGALSVGKFIDLTPGQEKTTLGLNIDESNPSNDYGALSPNYISENSANQINNIIVSKSDLGVYSNIELKVRTGGQSNERNIQVKINGFSFWMLQTDADNSVYENTSLITRENIYNSFLSAENLSQLLSFEINGLPTSTLNGLCSITTATEVTGDTEKNGVDSGFGTIISDDVSELDLTQFLLVKFYTEVNEVNGTGLIVLRLSGNANVAPVPENTVIRVLIDYNKSLTIPIVNNNGTINRREYRLEDFNTAKDLKEYFKQSEQESRQIVVQCNTDNNQDFIN